MPSAHPLSHPWDVTPAAARKIQERLRGHVVLEDDLGPVRYVAGTDVAFEQREVVKNEKRQGENQPYGRVFNAIVEGIFPQEYGWPW